MAGGFKVNSPEILMFKQDLEDPQRQGLLIHNMIYIYVIIHSCIYIYTYNSGILSIGNP